ncbi:MAG: zinc ribbon domain-containing protein [Blastocatellia bacterium]
MFCPGCGREVLGDRNFCNVCGINLLAIQQIITNNPQQPQVLPNQNLLALETPLAKQVLVVEKTHHDLKKLGLISMGAGVFMAISLEILSDALNIHFLSNLAPLGALVIVLGIMILIYRRLIYGSAKKPVVVVDSNNLQASQATTLPNPQTTNSDYQLPPGRPLFQSYNLNTATQQPLISPIAPPPQNYNSNAAYPYTPPSVTENTTKELKPPHTKPTNY